MKKILLILIFITISNAHTLIMNVLDNGDNTITVTGSFKFLDKEIILYLK